MKDMNVQLSEMNEGSVQERFNYELAQVVKNVMDPNTSHKKKRQIVITIDVTTDEYRDQIYLDSQVKSKLVPRDSVSTKALVGKKKDGTIVANEVKSDRPGQMYFDPEDSQLKDDVGTPVEEIEAAEAAESEQPSNGVINFRDKAKSN